MTADPGRDGPLTVGFNARVLAGDNPAGVARYARELLAAVGRCDPPLDVEFRLFGVEEVPSVLSDREYVRSAGEPAPAPSGPRAHFWEQFRLPLAVRRHDLDVFHTPAGQPPVVASVPLVTTIHDVSHVTNPEWFSRRYAVLHGLLTPMAVRRSNRLICISRSTRRDLDGHYPGAADKFEVVYNGVRSPSESPEPVPELSAGEFLLFVGSSMPRKNLERSLRAYRRYREAATEPVPLALVGPDRAHFADTGTDATARREAGEFDRSSGVRPLGYVSDEQLAWLYESAAALLFPSLQEGFGLPVLEAMRAGTPVVTSDRSATREVADGAAVLVDPEDVTDITDGIERALEAEKADELATAGRERAAKFTWERTACRTVAAYRAAVNGSDVSGDPAIERGAGPVAGGDEDGE